MGAKLDLTGQRFGRLVAISPAGKNDYGANLWRLACDCGGEKVAVTGRLRKGECMSCGCLAQESRAANGRNKRRTSAVAKHGLSRTPEYIAWLGIRSRCLNPNHRGYLPGVKISPEWSDFRKFLLDMGMRPSKKHRFERINTRGDFTPDNCHWTDKRGQDR